MIEQRKIDFTPLLGKVVEFLEVTDGPFTPFDLWTALGVNVDDINVYDVVGLLSMLEDDGMVETVKEPRTIHGHDDDDNNIYPIYVRQYLSKIQHVGGFEAIDANNSNFFAKSSGGERREAR